MPTEKEQTEETQDTENRETEDATGGDDATQPASEPENSGEKRFTQDEVNRLIDDRLKRERQKADEKAKKEREDAEAKALEEQKEYQKLAEQRATKIAELEPLTEQVDRYQGALTSLLTAEKQNVPEHVAALLDKLDPVEQLEWIASNRDKLAPASESNGDDAEPKKPKGIPSTPPRGDTRGAIEEQRRAARESTKRAYQRTF